MKIINNTKNIELNESDKKVLSQHALDMSRLEDNKTESQTCKVDVYGTLTNLKKI